MYLIVSIGFSLQSAVTLYIYRVGKTYPARNHVYRSKSIKNSNYTRTPPRPVRPVGPTGQTGWSCQTVYKHLDRSDHLDTPIRPVCSGYCQFWSSTKFMLPLGQLVQEEPWEVRRFHLWYMHAAKLGMKEFVVRVPKEYF